MPPWESRPLRVAIVRQRYRADGGGERFVDAAVEALASSGIAVTLISRSWNGRVRHRPDRVDHIRCNPLWLTRLGRERGFARKVGELLAGQSHDLVQSHERIPGCDIYRAGDGLHRSWLAERRRVLGPLARWWQHLSPFHRNQLAVERDLFLHPGLRAVICNSDMVRQEIIEAFGLPPDRLHLVYNGVDTQRFHPDLRCHRQALRARLGIGDDVPLLLFVGSGFVRKGLAQALEALRRTESAHLAVVGNDKRSAHFRRMASSFGIAKRVHFVGTQADVAPWYGASDGLLLPTLYDPFPNVVMEAMAAGLGVITSTRCGGAELVDAGVEGHVCDAIDIAALAGAIRQFEDPATAVRYGEAARRRIEPYTVEAMAHRLVALYQGLTRQGVTNPQQAQATMSARRLPTP